LVIRQVGGMLCSKIIAFKSNFESFFYANFINMILLMTRNPMLLSQAIPNLPVVVDEGLI
jgi:hypothetical protein